MATRLLNYTVRGINLIGQSNSIISKRWAGRARLPSYEQTLLNLPDTSITILKNGLKVASEDSGAPTCTVGIWLDAGSRHEHDGINGVANFVEHMLLKGTGKRLQANLELEIENMGAHFNSYTAREHTAFYLKCLCRDLPKAVEILSDMLQASKFEDAEIEREKGVILREMLETETNIPEVVFDYLHATAYQGTPLGLSVLGSTSNIKSIKKHDLLTYMKYNFKAPRILLIAAGGVKQAELVELATKHFGAISFHYEGAVPLVTPCRFTGSELRERDDWMPFGHIAVAVEAPGLNHPDVLPLMVASTMVGSWDRTIGAGENLSSNIASTLSQNKIGQSFQSFYIPYKDTGLWGIYYTCDPMHCEYTLHAIQEEWMRMCTSLTITEVERGKNTLRRNLLRQLDGTTQACEDIARQLLTTGRRTPLSELESRIQEVTPSHVRSALMTYVYNQCVAVAAVGPVENLPEYTRIRSGMYWIRL